MYKLHRDGAADDDEVEDGVPTYSEWELPNQYAPIREHNAINASG